MVESKAWNWSKASKLDIWKEPSIESYYLLNRWKKQMKKDFLDLGCGIGRHTILFAQNGFNTYAFDLSEEAVNATKKWAEELNLNVDYKIGDMLNLPYEDNSFDCILCRNVISHTDTKGVERIIKEINRVLREDGECYLTLGSKSSPAFNNKDFPIVDENTKIRVEDGPENGIPHFYADYDLIQELFKDNIIELVEHIEDFFEEKGKTSSSYHYHLLIKKSDINPELKEYIEEKIFPEYNKNGKSYDIRHIKEVMRNALILGKKYNMNLDMLYTAVAYHDIGDHIDRENHEKVSATIIGEDQKLNSFFNTSELKLIREAIEDHRSSKTGEPRNIYGKILASADKTVTIEIFFRRTYEYGEEHYGNIGKEEHIKRAWEHAVTKFGKDGYAAQKDYIENEYREKELKKLQDLIEDKEKFFKVADEMYKKYME